jgi:DNA-binding CsgD family transcriptional regulator
LVVVLDDLQWADDETMVALRLLPRQLASYPIGWVLARNDEEVGPSDLLFTLLEDEGATPIELGPLDGGAVADLLADALGAPPDEELLELAAGAGGNAFLVVELIEGLSDEQATEIVDGMATVVSSDVPERLQVAARDRLRRLSPGAAQLLEIGAVLGRSFSVDALADALDEPTARILPLLDEALTHGVLVGAGDALEFRHDLLRRAIYQAIPEAVRSSLHRYFGGTLITRGGSASAAAAHLLLGARPGDPLALAGLEQAAAKLVRSSPAVAAHLSLRAFELTERHDERWLARAVAATEHLVAAGRLEEAVHVARMALRQAVPDAPTVPLHLALASVLPVCGESAAGAREAELVLSRPDLDDGAYAAAEMYRLHAYLAVEDYEATRVPAEAIVAAGGGPSRAAVITVATVSLSYVAWGEGRVDEALGLMHDAVDRSMQAHGDAPNTYPELALARLVMSIGEFDEAEACIRHTQDEIDRVGDAAFRAAPATFLARLKLACCDLDGAEAEAHGGLRLDDDQGNRLFAPWLLWVLASVALNRGDLRDTADFVERYNTVRSEGEVVARSPQHSLLEGQLMYACEGAERSVETLHDLYDELLHDPMLLIEDPSAASWLTRTALAANDRRRAEAVVEVAEWLAEANTEFPTIASAASHARGLIEDDPAILVQAAEGCLHPLARASAAEDAGAALAAHGNRAEAVAVLDRALTVHDTSGADRDASRVRARLRKLGVRRRHWTHGDRPVEGWASLTETERTVSDNVAEGLTNRQVAERMFLSPHTVDFHLRQIFRKLDVSSRVELARQSLERDTATDV